MVSEHAKGTQKEESLTLAKDDIFASTPSRFSADLKYKAKALISHAK